MNDLREIRRDYLQLSELSQKKSAAILRQGRRLKDIADIIEAVDERASSFNGPICSTREELTDNELAEIYRLAKGLPQKQKETQESK